MRQHHACKQVKPDTNLLAVRPALGFDAHIGGSIAPIRGCTGGGGGGGIIASQEQGVAADSGMSHSCGLTQVLLAGAVLLKVDDAAAGHIAHLQQQGDGLLHLVHVLCCYVQCTANISMNSTDATHKCSGALMML